MPWTVYPCETSCGREIGCTIRAGDPVWESSVSDKLRRCRTHAPVPFDDGEFDAARHRLESHREGVEMLSAKQPDLLEES